MKSRQYSFTLPSIDFSNCVFWIVLVLVRIIRFFTKFSWDCSKQINAFKFRPFFFWRRRRRKSKQLSICWLCFIVRICWKCDICCLAYLLFSVYNDSLFSWVGIWIHCISFAPAFSLWRYHWSAESNINHFTYSAKSNAFSMFCFCFFAKFII